MTTTVDRMTDTELDRQVGLLRARLTAEFGPDHGVDQVVDEERHRFDDARIHSFLPILIERSARARLTRA